MEARIAEIDKPSPEQEFRSRYVRDDLKEIVARGKLAAMVARHLDDAEILKRLQEQVPELMYIWEDVAREGYEERKQRAFAAGANLDSKKPDPSRTIGGLVARFLKSKQTAKIEPNSLASLRYSLAMVTDCPALAPHIDFTSIKAETVSSLYEWLVNESGRAKPQQAKAMTAFRELMHWAWEEEILDQLPRNLRSRKHSFNLGQPEVQTYPVEAVRTLLASLTGKYRLWGLLALNCGMYASDMADLTWSEWKNGRISRIRTKTKNRGGILVSYPLWQETQGLLEKYASTHPVLVLATRTGQSMLRTATKADGTLSRTSRITRDWSMKKFAIPLSGFGSVRHRKNCRVGRRPAPGP
jgi:integrase